MYIVPTATPPTNKCDYYNTMSQLNTKGSPHYHEYYAVQYVRTVVVVVLTSEFVEMDFPSECVPEKTNHCILS